MPRLALAVAIAALLAGAAAPAFAQQKPPDAARVRTAAEQFDAGIAAFKQKDYEGAASRFEAADAAVPNAEALRQAIRARSEAGQGSRAATLSALALDRYPADSKVARVAREAIEKFGPVLHKVSVSCASPCLLAAGSRSVPGDANTRWVVYLDPGKEVLSASFFGGAGSAQREIKATAGGTTELRFDPEEKGKPAVAPAAPGAAPAIEQPKGNDESPPPEEPKPKGITPAVFIVGLVATAGLGGVTIWSGLDTIKNPGTDAVKKACAGKGESCPEYQEGRSKQLRTNILIGATAGTAAITAAIGIFATNWRGSKKKPDATSMLPNVLIDPRGAVLGASGSF